MGRLQNSYDYGIQDHHQRHARNETTHLRHQRSKQTLSGDCPIASSALREETEQLRDGSISFCNKSRFVLSTL